MTHRLLFLRLGRFKSPREKASPAPAPLKQGPLEASGCAQRKKVDVAWWWSIDLRTSFSKVGIETTWSLKNKTAESRWIQRRQVPGIKCLSPSFSVQWRVQRPESLPQGRAGQGSTGAQGKGESSSCLLLLRPRVHTPVPGRL